jgi:CubicO group peptidase (beta-lactamase class C family)
MIIKLLLGILGIYMGNGISMKNQIKQIEHYLSSAVEQDHFTGTVLIAHHGEIIFNHGYGMAKPQKPNDQDTVFHIASITKQFTAAALLKLWQAGKVDLHISINEYLPKEYQSDYWKKVTIHHLLSHTSGIPDYDASYYNPESLGFVSPEIEAKMIQETGRKELEFNSGSKFNYCNIGYTLLGIILEQQSAKKYTDIIQEYFLTPLQMTTTRFHEENYIPQKNDALGFRWDFQNKKWVDDESEKIVGTIPDGGILSTAHDLYKWSAVIAGKMPDVLSPEIIKQMIIPTPNTAGPYGAYGYGLWIHEFMGAKKVYHTGWMDGFTSDFWLFTEKDLVIIVLCNNTTANTAKITDELAKIMLS